MKSVIIFCLLFVLLACTSQKIVKEFIIEGQITEAGTENGLEGFDVYVLEEELSAIGGRGQVGILEMVESDSNGFYKIKATTRASGNLSISFAEPLSNNSFNCRFDYYNNSGFILKTGKSYTINHVFISRSIVQFNFDSFKSLEIDSLSINIANNKLLKPLTKYGEFEACNFCYPNKDPDVGLPITDKYCFEETPEPFQKSYTGTEAINSFYDLYAQTTVLSNFENTLSIKAYNNGAEVHSKSVTYNFKSDETNKTIKF